jgi:uncharacterized protein
MLLNEIGFHAGSFAPAFSGRKVYPVYRLLKFYEKYANRLVYGTDMGFDKPMYRVTFRILESLDEHFYEFEQFGYHWSLNGFGLSSEILKQVYHDNAATLLAACAAHAG